MFALSLACNLTLCGVVFMSRCQHPNCASKRSFNYNLGYTLLNHCPVELKFYFSGLSPGMTFFLNGKLVGSLISRDRSMQKYGYE